MAQSTSGLHAILGRAVIYNGLQRLIGADRARRRFVAEHFQTRPGDAVLDVGCGPGSILAYLDEVRYVGVDLSPAYIAAAQSRFGARGRFLVGDVNRLPELTAGSFDLALAAGLVHHLEDDEATGLYRRVVELLRPGGRLVTIDPCRAPDQSPIARWLIDRDRGQNVRSPEAYLALARCVFPEATARLRHDLLRLPYSHLVVEARRPG